MKQGEQTLDGRKEENFFAYMDGEMSKKLNEDGINKVK